ncbi:hypothetical protein F4604DRAFT_1677472 [Suillus subluteus]|nr:hypothetical protein F4604DRAFT_1677472 [Suillus subluteus]
MVIILAGEMLKKSENLLVMGLHPGEVIKGYELACTKVLAELERIPYYSPASKQCCYKDILLSLVAEASLAVMPKNLKNFNVDNVHVVKIMSGSLLGSKVVQGMVFGRELDGTILKNADEMLNFTCGEEQQFERASESSSQAYPSVTSPYTTSIASTSPFSKSSPNSTSAVARVVNATPLARVGTLTPEEAGYVDIFEMTEIGGVRVTVLRQLAPGEDGHQSHAEKTRIATIVLRGAMANHLDYLERAIEAATRMI